MSEKFKAECIVGITMGVLLLSIDICEFQRDSDGVNNGLPGDAYMEFLLERHMGEDLPEFIGEFRAEFIGETNDKPFPFILGQSKLDAGIVMIEVFVSLRAVFIGEGRGDDVGSNNCNFFFNSSQEGTFPFSESSMYTLAL